MIARIKVMRSHSELAQFLHEAGDEIGWVPRGWVAQVPSPYHYAPIKAVYQWRGKRVFWSEVSHRRYCVYELPAIWPVYDNPDVAEEANFHNVKEPA
jgi:hypothetical protein